MTERVKIEVVLDMNGDQDSQNALALHLLSSLHPVLGIDGWYGIDPGSVSATVVPALRGEAHGMSKLTEDQARRIRDWPKADGIRQMLARRYGISLRTVDDIRQGRTWKHLGGTA